MIDGYFNLAENHTSVEQEMLGGLTTFVTMAYIVVSNPQILAQAGMPSEGVVFATCISAAVATLVMGELKFMQVGESSKINGGRQDWRGNRRSRLAQETPGLTSVHPAGFMIAGHITTSHKASLPKVRRRCSDWHHRVE